MFFRKLSFLTISIVAFNAEAIAYQCAPIEEVYRSSDDIFAGKVVSSKICEPNKATISSSEYLLDSVANGYELVCSDIEVHQVVLGDPGNRVSVVRNTGLSGGTPEISLAVGEFYLFLARGEQPYTFSDCDTLYLAYQSKRLGSLEKNLGLELDVGGYSTEQNSTYYSEKQY